MFCVQQRRRGFKFRLWCFHRTIWKLDLRLLDFELCLRAQGSYLVARKTKAAGIRDVPTPATDLQSFSLVTWNFLNFC
jgi:hypothetical protein